MDKEALIDKILKKVLEELKKEKKSSLNEKTKELPIIAYLGSDKILKSELEKKYEVIDADIKMSKKDFGSDKEIKKIIISELCINNLINISQGKKNFVIENLLEGKEVCLVEEGLEYKKYTGPTELIKVYDEYVEKIKTFGIKVIKRSEITEIFDEKKKLYIDGIITENKLKNKDLKNKVIVIKKNSKMTSLAQDYIKKNNIEVCYERGQ